MIGNHGSPLILFFFCVPDVFYLRFPSFVVLSHVTHSLGSLNKCLSLPGAMQLRCSRTPMTMPSTRVQRYLSISHSFWAGRPNINNSDLHLAIEQRKSSLSGLPTRTVLKYRIIPSFIELGTCQNCCSSEWGTTPSCLGSFSRNRSSPYCAFKENLRNLTNEQGL